MTPPLDSGADSTALHAIDFPLWGSRLIEATAVSKTVTGLTAGTQYYWWLKAANGSGTTTTGTMSTPTSGRSESQAARIVRLEAELAASKAEKLKLETERDILRQAAKYFAGETNW